MKSNVIKWLVGMLLSPIVKIGEKYLDNQKDKERLKAATDQLAYSADAAMRPAKWAHWMGRLPLFIAEMSASLYLASVLVDSMFPSEYLNPLELPGWFKPHYHAALASVLGIAAVERTARFFKR